MQQQRGKVERKVWEVEGGLKALARQLGSEWEPRVGLTDTPNRRVKDKRHVNTSC